MTPVSAPLLATGSLSASHGTDRDRLATAAKAFEAIFVRQMLAAARQSGMGDSLISGQGLETFRAMQDSHFADLAAKTGALGLAKQIKAQLARHLPPSETANGQ
jgi:flagellar protein FlgJ